MSTKLERVAEYKTVRWATKNSVKVKTKLRSERLDRWFLLPGGRPFIIEFKRKDKKPSKLQEHEINELKRLGYDIEVHECAEEAIAAIKKRVEATRLHEKSNKIHART